MYRLHEQYLDMASGFHVIELRDERGTPAFAPACHWP